MRDKQKKKDYYKRWLRDHQFYHKNWRKNNREKLRRYREKHREKIREYQRKYHKEWRKKNPEKARKINRICRKRWYQKNKDKCKKWLRAYQRKNREKVNAYQRNYYKERTERQKEAKRLKDNNRVALKIKAEGFITIEEWERLKRKYDYTCQGCKKKEPEIKLTIDHIIPLTKNGTNWIANIQPLCKSCNSSKSNNLLK